MRTIATVNLGLDHKVSSHAHTRQVLRDLQIDLLAAKSDQLLRDRYRVHDGLC